MTPESDDVHRHFNILVSPAFLSDVVECMTLCFYYTLDEKMINVAMGKNRWDLAVLELCTLSGYAPDEPELLDVVYNHLGSIVAHYAVPNTTSIGSTFNTMMPMSFIQAFFTVESGDVAYYHHGSYVCQIHPAWNEQQETL